MAPILMAADTLLVGCGRLGADVGLRLVAAGHEVAAIRRRAELVPPPLQAIRADLTQEQPTLPPLQSDMMLVVALTARPRTAEAYRATYVDGMARALDALDATDHRPRRAVLVSSTATLRADPDGPAQMLLAAEELFHDRVPGGTVLRLSGLYDRTSTRLTDQVRSGHVTDPHRWTNRIHREDAAAAVVHLLTRPEQPGRMYVGTDDEPAQLGDVAAFLAARLGAPDPPPADQGQGHGTRLSNTELRATGWVPRYRSYRDGYADPA